jgi:hypothetical protein
LPAPFVAIARGVTVVYLVCTTLSSKRMPRTCGLSKTTQKEREATEPGNEIRKHHI